MKKISALKTAISSSSVSNLLAKNKVVYNGWLKETYPNYVVASSQRVLKNTQSPASTRATEKTDK